MEMAATALVAAALKDKEEEEGKGQSSESDGEYKVIESIQMCSEARQECLKQLLYEFMTFCRYD